MSMGKEEELRGALARAYTTERNSHKVLDPGLVEDMVKELLPIVTLKGLDEGKVANALKNLTESQCLVIKDGIVQNGRLGHYGRSFIAHAICEAYSKGELSKE